MKAGDYMALRTSPSLVLIATFADVPTTQEDAEGNILTTNPAKAQTEHRRIDPERFQIFPSTPTLCLEMKLKQDATPDTCLCQDIDACC